MKSQFIILALSALVLTSMAQETNSMRRGDGENRPDRKKGSRSDFMHKSGRPEMSAEEKAKMQERRLQLMEKSLKEIGVTPEQQQQIQDLQEKHRAQMKAIYLQTELAREKLSMLQDQGASQELLYAAIDEISDAQSDQLKILVRGRMEMESVLGKEKYTRFMETARNKFREHGRRGGPGMPPRPNEPPIPTDSKTPPRPPAVN
jgi:hypothetical protein